MILPLVPQKLVAFCPGGSCVPPNLEQLLAQVFGPWGVINVLLFTVAPILLLVMLVWGGVNRLLAADNPQGVKQSTATITWAVIGFGVIVVARMIVALLAELVGFDWGGPSFSL